MMFGQNRMAKRSHYHAFIWRNLIGNYYVFKFHGKKQIKSRMSNRQNAMKIVLNIRPILIEIIPMAETPCKEPKYAS